MFQIFSGDTADEVWRASVSLLVSGGEGTTSHASRSGSTREVLRAAFTIHHPRQRWVLSRQPAISPAFALAEVIWIMAGRNDSNVINFFNRILPRFAGTGPTYHGAYGFRLRRHFDGIDQLDRAYQILLQQPHSRQVVLQLWDPRCDLPHADGTPAAQDIPCNVAAFLNIRNGRLEWTQMLRSNDVFLGLPHNFVQFTTLHEVMAGWLGVEVGRYCQVSNSLHLYERDCRADLIAKQPVHISNTDDLALPRRVSDAAFAELANYIDAIAAATTSVSDLVQMVLRVSLPTPFKNMLCVLCAEGARRRQAINVAYELLRHCTNPSLTYLAELWIERWCSAAAAAHIEQMA